MAYRAGRKSSWKAIKNHRFAFLIPAHNEEKLLPVLLESIKQVNYPTACYDVHVIADNCTDQTADIALNYGSLVYRRFNKDLIGKGHALKWGLEQIQKAGLEYDAFIVIDADSEISANFLEVMNQQLESGGKVIQAYYAVKNPTQSWNISLRYAAFCVLHFLRPQGRMILGGSAGLKGNGMVFTPDIFSRFPWPASITEDIEYHMMLLLNGYTVKFAPDAIVWSEMPAQFNQSQTQLDRWEYGRVEMAKKFIPALFKNAVASLKSGNFQQTYIFFDAIMEHIIPPFTLMVVASAIFFLIDLAMLIATYQVPSLITLLHLAWINCVFGIFLVGGQFIYLISGLQLAHAPRVVYQRLLFAPIFIFLKVGQLLRMLGGNKPQKWVKTVRN